VGTHTGHKTVAGADPYSHVCRNIDHQIGCRFKNEVDISRPAMSVMTPILRIVMVVTVSFVVIIAVVILTGITMVMISVIMTPIIDSTSAYQGVRGEMD
jgi:hypothetical protein